MLHGKQRSTTIPAVAITLPTSTEYTNVTITAKINVLLYRARTGDEFIQTTSANTTLTVDCLMSFEGLWIELRITSCDQARPSLQGTIIRSTRDMVVYAAEAECNVTRCGREFGYVGYSIYSLPPSRKWGTEFITDFSHL